MSTLGAVIVAGGGSARCGFNKLLAPLGGGCVLASAIAPFLREDISQIVVVAPLALWSSYRHALPEDIRRRVVWAESGETRALSVRSGLEVLTTDYVLVHDAARPYLEDVLVDRIIEGLQSHPDCGIIPVALIVDSVVGEKGYIDRNTLRAVQTPQGFHREQLLACIQRDATDEGTSYARTHRIVYVPGDSANRKITYPHDLPTRHAVGYDIHTLAAGRRMVLGGVELPSQVGCVGHSDADVLIHAVMDALLSAAGLKDIGHQFPDTDPTFKDANSMELLAAVRTLTDLLVTPMYASICIIADTPRLAPYVDSMRESLATGLSIPASRVGITVGTNEGVPLVPHVNAIACIASITVLPR